MAACGNDEPDDDREGDGDEQSAPTSTETAGTGGSGSAPACDDHVEPVELQVVVTPVEPAGDDELADAAAVVCARVSALAEGLAVVVEDGTVVVRGPDATLRDRAVGLIEDDAVVTFRAVLDRRPAEGAGAPPVTPPGEGAPDASVVLDDDAGTRYELAPVSLSSDAIEAAEADVAQGMWQVRLTMRAGVDGMDAFNDLAGRCYEASPECPLGQLAIVHDSTVLSAPQIQEPSFERDQISINGQFDEAQARSLAAALHAGELPMDVEVRAVTPD